MKKKLIFALYDYNFINKQNNEQNSSYTIKQHNNILFEILYYCENLNRNLLILLSIKLEHTSHASEI